MSKRSASPDRTPVEIKRGRATANMGIALAERLQQLATDAKYDLFCMRERLRNSPIKGDRAYVIDGAMADHRLALRRLISNSTSLLARLEQLEPRVGEPVYSAEFNPHFETLRAAFRDWCRLDFDKVWDDPTKVRAFATIGGAVDGIKRFRAFVLEKHAADATFCAAVQDDALDLAFRVGLAEYRLYAGFTVALDAPGTDEGDEAVYTSDQT